MIRSIQIFVFLLIGFSVSGQPRVIPGDQEPYTPEILALNRFIGDGVIINSLNHIGTNNSVGYFADYGPLIGFDEGIILSTGVVVNANEPNDSGDLSGTTSNTSINDADLQNIVGSSPLFDISKFVIEFIPLSDSLSFNYVFASEEYNEFVCSDFNDIFGFFLTGPDPDGGMFNAKNIALVPDPADPSGNTFLDIPVRINTVNNGMQGSHPTTDIVNCEGVNGSLDYAQYFNENPAGAQPTFDGFLNTFKAKSAVVPCETYTMSIVIADVLDQDFDSAVFLEAKSFSAGFLEVITESQSIDGTLAEGCTDGNLRFELPEIRNTDYTFTLNLLDPADFPDGAIENVDYSNFPDQITIPAGSLFVTAPLTIINDDIDEGTEFIYFDIIINDCLRDTLQVAITDDILTDVFLPEDVTICPGDSFLIQPSYPSNFQVPIPKAFNNDEDIIIQTAGQQYKSTIEVSGVKPELLDDRFLRSVCIDTFIARNLNDFSFYLQGPDNQLLELSTDNGYKDQNDMDIDTFLNTWFSMDATLNINNGNAIQGDIYPTNQTYSGNYFPEGEWSDFFFSNDAVVNGTWTLIILSDQPQMISDLAMGLPVLKSWSVSFFADYTVDYNWFKDGEPYESETFRNQTVHPTGLEEYVFQLTDSRGCEVSDTILIDLYDRVLPPVNPICADEGFSEVTISWDASPNANCYSVRLNPEDEWMDIGNVTEYTIMNLGFNQTVDLFIRAKDDNCFSTEISIQCMTDPCPPPTAQIVHIEEPSCFEIPNGELEVSASGGSGGPYTYSIQGQTNTTGVFTGLFGGDDVVFITDVAGCPFELDITIPQPDALDIDFVIQDISCHDANDGMLEAIVVATFNPVSVEWENASTDFIRNSLSEGWYYITATDGNGCMGVDSAFIENPPLLELEELIIDDVSCFGLTDGSIEIIHTGGTGPYIYTWDHGPLTPLVENLGVGTYNATVEDARGCSLVIDQQISQPEELVLMTEGNAVACYNSEDGLASVFVEGGTEPYQYLWEDGSTNDMLFNTTGGEHFVTVTDANGCMETAIAIVDSPDSIEIVVLKNDVSCFGYSDGDIDLEVDQNLSILWNTGATTNQIANLEIGTYCATVTDPNDCTNSICIDILQPDETQVQTDITNTTCDGDLDGSIEIAVAGATPPYEYAWSGPGPFNSTSMNIDNLAMGQYYLTVTDTRDCIAEFSFEVESESPIFFTFIGDTINCAGASTGMISVHLDGVQYPVTYDWRQEDGLFVSADSTVSNLTSGNYELFVTDANGCMASEMYFLPEKESVTITLDDLEKVICGGASTGSISISVSGGTGPYDFLWNNGLVTEDIVNVSAGVYTVIVTDRFDCQSSESFEVPENDVLNAVITTEPVGCIGDGDGRIVVEGMGGLGEYIYALDDGLFSSNGTFIGLEAGIYSLTMEDVAGCSRSFDDISLIDEFSISLDLGDNIITEFASNVELTPTLGGNVDGLIYQWETIDPDVLSCYDCDHPLINGIQESVIVRLTVTNEHGCSASDEVQVTLSRGIIIKVPTGFTPNGDGNNDLLTVFGKEGTVVNYFRIYSRWGELIFEHTNFDIELNVGWDGRFNGNLLNPGVYQYVIEAQSPDGTVDLFKGNTTLIR